MDYCAKDSGLETADLSKIVPFKLEGATVVEVAKLLTIHFVHTLKSPVIVTPTFLQSVVSFLESQPKNSHLMNGGGESEILNGDHIVECMSTLDTIRALCFPGLYRGLFTSVQIANYIILVCEIKGGGAYNRKKRREGKGEERGREERRGREREEKRERILEN